MKKQAVLFLFFSIILFIIGVNLFLKISLEKQNTVVKKTPPKLSHSTSKAPNQSRRKKVWTKAELAKMGIFIQSKENIPRTPLQWDHYMKKVLIDSKVLEQPSAKEAMTKMAKTPEKYTKRMEEVNARIKSFEEKLAADPLNEDVEKRLQALYMLKALGEVLKDKIVSP